MIMNWPKNIPHEKQIEIIISLINDEKVIVFHVPRDNERYELVETKETKDELRAYTKSRIKYVDLYNVTFDDIEAYYIIDWEDELKKNSVNYCK